MDIKKIIFGNILAISDFDLKQLIIVSSISLLVLIIYWKDIMIVFFDEMHSSTIGISPNKIKLIFFIILTVSTVAALQTVGAFLVIALIITPGATAFLLTKEFSQLIIYSVTLGSLASFFGSYLSYYIDGATGGTIVVLMTIAFFVVFMLKKERQKINA